MAKLGTVIVSKTKGVESLKKGTFFYILKKNVPLDGTGNAYYLVVDMALSASMFCYLVINKEGQIIWLEQIYDLAQFDFDTLDKSQFKVCHLQARLEE